MRISHGALWRGGCSRTLRPHSGSSVTWLAAARMSLLSAVHHSPGLPQDPTVPRPAPATPAPTL